MTTRGSRSSEKNACYVAFYVGVLIAAYGLYKEVDLSDLAFLIPAVSTPLMWYAGARSFVKSRKGEKSDG